MQEGARPVRVSVAVATAALALVLPGRAAAVPAAPVLQTDAPVTSDSPHVYWDAVAGADRYQITRLNGCTNGTAVASSTWSGPATARSVPLSVRLTQGTAEP